jgi:hypothetical protein
MSKTRPIQLSLGVPNPAAPDNTWYFTWDNSNSRSTLILHDKTQDQAMAIAKEWGWQPRTWYRPSTWRNQVWSNVTIS